MIQFIEAITHGLVLDNFARSDTHRRSGTSGLNNIGEALADVLILGDASSSGTTAVSQ